MGEVVLEERAGFDSSAVIAGGPERGVVLWMNGTQILGELVDKDAKPVRPLSPATWPGGTVGVERCGDRWMAAWIADGSAFVAPIDDEGARGEPLRVAGGVYTAAFACDGDRALLAWGTEAAPRTLYATEIVGGAALPAVRVAEEGSMWLSARRDGVGWQLAWSVDTVGRVARVEAGEAEVEVVGPGWRPVFVGSEVVFGVRKGDARAWSSGRSSSRALPHTFAATAVGDRWFGAGTVDGHMAVGPLEGPRVTLGKLSQYPGAATIADRAVFAWVQVGVVHGVSVDAATGLPGPQTVLSVQFGEALPAQRNPKLAVGPSGYLLAWEVVGSGCEGISARRIGPQGESGEDIVLVPCTDAQLRGLELEGSPLGWLVAWTDKRDHDYAADLRELKYVVVGADVVGAPQRAGTVRGARLAAAWDGASWQLQSDTSAGLVSRAIGADGVARSPVARLPGQGSVHQVVCDDGCATIAATGTEVTFSPWGGRARTTQVDWPEEATTRRDGAIYSRTGSATQVLATWAGEATIVYAAGDIGWAQQCTPDGCDPSTPARVRSGYGVAAERAFWSERDAAGADWIVDASGPVAPGSARAVACATTCLAATLATDASGVPRITVAPWP